MVKVLVIGALGKMGSEVVKTLVNSEKLELVGAVDINEVGSDIGSVLGLKETGVKICSNLEEAIRESKCDVMVDFTNPHLVYNNIMVSLKEGINCVVGTTGLKDSEIEEIKRISQEKKLGVLWATNFSIGAILMMRFSKEAAKYFPDVEIIEYHHENKLDAPSGTALTTMNLIKEVRSAHIQGQKDEKEFLPGARGGDLEGMKVHSVRLPGFVASQDVIFGDNGQSLKISHNTINRGCFMEGVALSCEKIINEVGFIDGLDNLI